MTFKSIQFKGDALCIEILEAYLINEILSLTTAVILPTLCNVQTTKDLSL